MLDKFLDKNADQCLVHCKTTEFFCRTCRTAICSDCKREIHEAHDVCRMLTEVHFSRVFDVIAKFPMKISCTLSEPDAATSTAAINWTTGRDQIYHY